MMINVICKPYCTRFSYHLEQRDIYDNGWHLSTKTKKSFHKQKSYFMLQSAV